MPQKTFYNCIYMKKSLKPVFILTGILYFYLPLSAQTYRIEAGYLNHVRSGSGLSSTYFDGAQVGVSSDFALKNNFSYSVGGYYSFLYSFKEQLFPHDTYVRYTTYSHSLDIPVRLNYTLTIKKVKLFAYAGPNFNIGLYQPQKTVSTLTPELRRYSVEKISFKEWLRFWIARFVQSQNCKSSPKWVVCFLRLRILVNLLFANKLG